MTTWIKKKPAKSEEDENSDSDGSESENSDDEKSQVSQDSLEEYEKITKIAIFLDDTFTGDSSLETVGFAQLIYCVDILLTFRYSCLLTIFCSKHKLEYIKII